MEFNSLYIAENENTEYCNIVLLSFSSVFDSLERYCFLIDLVFMINVGKT